MKRTALVIAAVVALLLVAGGLWYVLSGFPARTSWRGTRTYAPPERPAPPVGEYETRAAAAVAPLRVALEANDQAALDAAVPVAKSSLMELVVPSDAQSAHLALVLALAKYEQATAQSVDTAPSRADITRALTVFPQSP